MALTYTAIAKHTVSSAVHSVTMSNIPQTYTDLKVVYSLRSNYSGGGHEGQFIFNSVTSGYTQRLLYGTGSGVGSASPGTSSIATWTLTINGGTTTSSTFSNGEIYIPNYSSTSVAKSWGAEGVTEDNATGALAYLVAGTNTSTAAISSLTFYAWQSFINFVSGSTFELYGIKKD